MKKVLLPSKILSDAPSLVNMRSTGVSSIFSAGTKQPSYAKITARHVYLSSVDLPPMFGPVKIIALAGSSLHFKYVEFGTNFLTAYL